MIDLGEKLLQNQVATAQRKAIENARKILQALNDCDTKWSHAQGKITKRVLEEDNYPIVISEVFEHYSHLTLFILQFKKKVNAWAKQNNLKIVLSPVDHVVLEFHVYAKNKRRFWIW